MKADPLRGSENQGNQYLLPVGRMGTAQGSQRTPYKASLHVFQHMQLQVSLYLCVQMGRVFHHT